MVRQALTAAAALTMATGAAASRCVAQEPSELAVRLLVVQALTAEDATIEPLLSGESDANRVRLEALKLKCGALRLFRGTDLHSYPSHPYMVAAVGAKLLPLGGFESPQLLMYDLELRKDPLCGNLTLSQRVELLVQAVDPEGAADVRYARDSVRSPMVATLIGLWPEADAGAALHDGTHVLDDGTTMVRATVFTHRRLASVRTWRPITYVFVFSGQSSLLAWSAREWPEFLAGE